MLLVAAALTGGIVLLIAGGDDDGSPDSRASRDVRDLQDSFLKRTVVSARDGISVRRPADWKDSKNAGVITLQSADRCVAIHLSASGPAQEAKKLRTDALKTLRGAYNNVLLGPGGGAEVGGIPTASNTVALTDDEGLRRRVLLSVGTGRKNAYLTEVVLGNPSCEADLSLAQVVLSSLEYTK